MIRAGFETVDPRTLTRSVVVAGGEETEGRGWVLEVHCPEGASAAILAHLHLTWTETFEILQGTAKYVLGGQEHALAEGDKVVMPPNVPHVHPWNAGTGVMVYRQTNDFGGVDASALHDVIGAFATINDLARAGQVDKKGLPRNPLQFAATLRSLTNHGGYDASVPVVAQRIVATTLGRLAEALGYRGVDPRYSS